MSAVIHCNNNDQLHKDNLCDIVSKQVQDPQASLHTLVSSVEGSSMKGVWGVWCGVVRSVVARRKKNDQLYKDVHRLAVCCMSQSLAA